MGGVCRLWPNARINKAQIPLLPLHDPHPDDIIWPVEPLCSANAGKLHSRFFFVFWFRRHFMAFPPTALPLNTVAKITRLVDVCGLLRD